MEERKRIELNETVEETKRRKQQERVEREVREAEERSLELRRRVIEKEKQDKEEREREEREKERTTRELEERKRETEEWSGRMSAGHDSFQLMGRRRNDGRENEEDEEDEEVSNLSSALHADRGLASRPIFETPTARSGSSRPSSNFGRAPSRHSARPQSTDLRSRPQSTTPSKFEEERKTANAWFQKRVDACNDLSQMKALMKEWSTFMEEMEIDHRRREEEEVAWRQGMLRSTPTPTSKETSKTVGSEGKERTLNGLGTSPGVGSRLEERGGTQALGVTRAPDRDQDLDGEARRVPDRELTQAEEGDTRAPDRRLVSDGRTRVSDRDLERVEEAETKAPNGALQYSRSLARTPDRSPEPEAREARTPQRNPGPDTREARTPQRNPEPVERGAETPDRSFELGRGATRRPIGTHLPEMDSKGVTDGDTKSSKERQAGEEYVTRQLLTETKEFPGMASHTQSRRSPAQRAQNSALEVSASVTNSLSLWILLSPSLAMLPALALCLLLSHLLLALPLHTLITNFQEHNTQPHPLSHTPHPHQLHLDIG